MGVGIYFRETRPQFLLLTPACCCVGVGTAAWVKGGLRTLPWGYVILALVGALCAHIATNVLNDYFDYVSGLDLKTRRTPFSGGSGIIPQGLMSSHKALIFGLAALGLTAAIGCFFWAMRGWGILPLGIIGIIVIISYTPWVTTRPVLCLVAPGLGFGPLMVMGTHFVLTGRYDGVAILASVIPGLLVSNLLLLNQFPDVEADAAINRRHIPIVFGRVASAWLYAAFAVGTYIWIVCCWALGSFPASTLIALIPLPLALVTIKGVIKNTDNIKKLIPYLGQNVIYTLATPLLLGIGFMIA
jgi:1,4-dihydroxy-2-naphthoate octaprenyltransferase